MRQLSAILKDSFREAIDAKVIWVLLGLSVLICLITFSFSFTPSSPEPAFQEITSKFDNVFPEQGKGKIPIILQGANFTPSDIKLSNGEYSLRLTAKPSGKPDFGFNSAPFGGGQKDKKDKIDSIRFAVVNWLKPAGPSRTFSMPGSGLPMEVAVPTEVTAAEANAVTDDQLAAFIKDQFATHAGMTDVTVTRITDGVNEPEYAFDVKARSTDAVRGWPHITQLFFGAVTISKEFPLGVVLWFIEDRIINGYGAALTLLIGVVITGFFIPNMLRKGALDLLITKPISRPALLIYKYIGGLSYMLILSIATIGGIWVVLAIRSGFWNPNFLLLIPILTFTFAILYAFSTFVAVFTRSSIAAILLTCGFAFFLYIVGSVKILVDDYRADPKHTDDVNKTLVTCLDGLHFILPRYKDVDRLTTKLIADATLTPLEQYAFAKSKVEYPSWGETFGVSFGFIAIMLALSCWRFQTRDS
ncbi:MAG TPA: ABC transporter permease subunit [Gemmata sp.]|jgi:ABC-type transport system involved in multi-copper enzyme maturation permease subunit|nr:ABC transporter permease subunit [Gemmata sp.]